MRENCIIRRATADDIPFLVETIIASEKSGTTILGYSTIFGLTLLETKWYLAKMLKAEEDNCGELSISNYLVVEREGEILASSCSWIEKQFSMSSTLYKSNLLLCSLPVRSLDYARKIIHYISDLSINYPSGGLCLGSLYVDPIHRGKFLEIVLIQEHLKRAINNSNPFAAFSQCYANNEPALLLMKRIFKFHEELIVISKFVDIQKYLPWNEKVLLKKAL